LRPARKKALRHAKNNKQEKGGRKEAEKLAGEARI